MKAHRPPPPPKHEAWRPYHYFDVSPVGVELGRSMLFKHLPLDGRARDICAETTMAIRLAMLKGKLS